MSDLDVQLPIDSDSPHYQLGVVLDGVAYTIVMRWNPGRPPLLAGAWYMDLLDADGDEDNPILVGAKLVLGALIGRDAYDPRFPRGAFFVSDLSGLGIEATLYDLGTRVVVYYRPEAGF